MSYNVILQTKTKVCYRRMNPERRIWFTRWQTVLVPRHAEGGTYVAGGTHDADLNVTYNYVQFFDFSVLYHRKAADTIPLMEEAVARLGTERSQNYWEATPGNAGYAVSILLGWAKLHPKARWEVV